MRAFAALMSVAAVGSVVACTRFDAAADDAGADAETQAEAAASEGGSAEAGGAYCAAHAPPALCSDFDGAEPLAGWIPSTEGSGSVRTSETTFLSSPRSFAPSLTGKTYGRARLEHDVPPATKRMRLSFDVKLGAVSLPVGGQISIGELLCADATAGTYDGLWLFLEGPSRTLVALSNKGGTRTPLPALGSEWTRVMLDVRFDTTPATVDIVIGSMKVAPVVLPTPCSSYRTFQVVVGLSTAGQVPAKAFYDNVLYEPDPTGP
jgi:hypothetical protein